jgi:site-specific recombinase XerD
MELLQAGVDISVIALWLGLESIQLAQVYLHAHIALTIEALAKHKRRVQAEPARVGLED